MELSTRFQCYHQQRRWPLPERFLPTTKMLPPAALLKRSRCIRADCVGCTQSPAQCKTRTKLLVAMSCGHNPALPKGRAPEQGLLMSSNRQAGGSGVAMRHRPRRTGVSARWSCSGLSSAAKLAVPWRASRLNRTDACAQRHAVLGTLAHHHTIHGWPGTRPGCKFDWQGHRMMLQHGPYLPAYPSHVTHMCSSSSWHPA